MAGPDFVASGNLGPLRIDANSQGDSYIINGKVGIGTSGPAEALHLYTPSGSVRQVIETAAADGSEVRLDLKRGAAAGWANVLFLTGATLEWTIGLRAGDSGLQFHDETGSVVRMYIGTDGKVGIGTTSPFSKLANSPTNYLVNGIGVGTNSLLWRSNEAGYVASFVQDASGSDLNQAGVSINIAEITNNVAPDKNAALAVLSGNIMRLMVAANGNVGVGTTTPAAKLDVSGDVAIPNFGSGAAYRARRVDGAIKPLLFVQNDAALADATRLRSAGSGVAIQSDAGANLMVVLDGGNVGIGTVTPDPAFKLHVNGDVKANNNVKVYESQWQPISGLGTLTLQHNLGAFPKMVTVWCAESANPSKMSLAGPFYVDTAGGSSAAGVHDHPTSVGNSSTHTHGIPERGAYVDQVDTVSLHVRAGNYIGINEAGTGWLTSGYYKVTAWA